MRILSFTAVFLTFIAALSQPALSVEMVIDEADGGWRGDDVAMVCKHGAGKYEVFIVNGVPGIRLNGKKVELWAATLKPYGFLSFLKEYDDSGKPKEWVFYAGDFQAAVLGMRLLYAGDVIRVECQLARIKK